MQQREFRRNILLSGLTAIFTGFFCFVIARTAREHSQSTPILCNTKENKSQLVFSPVEVSHVTKTGQKLPTIMCMIVTSNNTMQRALAANDTYVHRCDNYRFFTDVEIPGDRHFVRASNWSHRDVTWLKLKDIYPWVLQNFPNYDWYVRLCDDTYVIVENLRDYVAKFDPEKPFFFGSLHKKDLPGGYVTGSAIVFSRKTFQIVVNEIIPHEDELCYTGMTMGDDVITAINITPIDTRDRDGSQRFHPLKPEDMAMGMKHDYMALIGGGDHFHSGIAAFSERSISFHYLKPFEVRWMDFLIYRIKVPRSPNRCFSSP